MKIKQRVASRLFDYVFDGQLAQDCAVSPFDKRNLRFLIPTLGRFHVLLIE